VGRSLPTEATRWLHKLVAVSGCSHEVGEVSYTHKWKRKKESLKRWKWRRKKKKRPKKERGDQLGDSSGKDRKEKKERERVK
jgi:hypothetical protein